VLDKTAMMRVLFENVRGKETVITSGMRRSRRSATLPLLTVAVYIFACASTTRTLTWEDTSQDEEGFRIYRVVGKDRKIIAEVAPNVTRYVDRNAPSNACYIITAFNAAGESSPSNSACQSASSPTALSRAGK
jgi:serine protease